MADDYKPLVTYPLDSDVSFFHPAQPLPPQVHADDPALQVMTDLRQVRAMTVGPNTALDSALDKMMRDGVRMLLVISPRGVLEGIITARDIQGEKPVKFVQGQGVEREVVRVRDIMTPRDRMEVLRIEEVRRAKVGDIVATLKRLERQHALVTDMDEDSSRVAVRGVFSATQIAKQLGVRIETARVTAKTFSELEAALRT